MGHTCPACGQACYCNGDIDDCINDFEEDVMNCTHYLECQQEDQEFEREYDDDEDDR